MGTDHEHRVCTYAEADAAVRRRRAFYVNNCFCRTPAKQGQAKQPYCGHPLETCLSFRNWVTGDMAKAYPQRKVTRQHVQRMMEDWKKRGNFFRFMAGDAAICLCCPCGCGFFFDKNGKPGKDHSGKSPFREQTDRAACTLCRKCMKVCAYKARRIAKGKMLVTASKCYGCSACEYACPTGAITMVPR
jgi:Pyruvate/2-oxoacid:ferredoxin oxidoreductase delta subunit